MHFLKAPSAQILASRVYTLVFLCKVYNIILHSLLTEISDERAQEIIDKALEKSSLDVKNVVAVITGLMGSGKTWLLSRLFHKLPPEHYTSTGVAEQSCQGLLQHIGDIESWDLLSDNDICELLAPFFRSGVTDTDIESLTTNLDAINPSDEATSTSPASPPTATLPQAAPQQPAPQLDPEPAPPVPPQSLSIPKEITAKKAIVSEVKQTTSYKRELTLQLVHMIDTGGQPELMEVMPSLIHNANLAVLVLNLMYGLDDHPPINFHVEGVPYQRKGSSQYSSRQIIMKLASTLQAKNSCLKAGTIFRLLVVATHRDCVKGDVAARVEALNQELSSLLLPAFEEELVLFETPDKIAFILDLKMPNTTDEQVLELIRTKFKDSSVGTVFKVPGTLFMLQQMLREISAYNKRDILSLDECVQLGGKEMKMNEEVVKGALVLFHHQNTFLYYRHILPYHIFIKPQIPFDFFNSIVRFSYQVCAGGLQGVPATFVSSLKAGIITEEILGHPELSSHFIPGFYKPEHAIKLFSHSFTIAPLSHDQQQSKLRKKLHLVPKRKEEYLMMCLLPAIPEDELPQYLPSSSDKVPLVVTFSRDCVPLSCFSSTISCLLATYQWKVTKKDAKTKECLAHNIVSLRDPKLPVKIVLVDAATHIKVYIDSSKKHRDILPTVCSHVRKTVFGAIEKVLDVMQLSEIEVSPAVECPCEEEPRIHFASHCVMLKKDYLCCSITDTEEEMTDDKHKMWFGTTLGKIHSDHITSTPPHMYMYPRLILLSICIGTSKPPTLPQLLELYIPLHVADKYESFGIFLLNDDNGDKMAIIKNDCRGYAKDITRAVLKEWLQGGGMSPTWESLIEALRKCKLISLADNIQKEH